MNPPSTSAAVPALRGMRVLVVEDDALLLMELEAILLDAGAQAVSVCRTVEDGVAAAQQNGITAAVLDVRIGRDTIASGGPAACDPWDPVRVLYRPGRQRPGHRGMAGPCHRRKAGAGENYCISDRRAAAVNDR